MAEKTTQKKPNALVRAWQSSSKVFRDTKNEIKKIVWPAPNAVFRNMGVVLVTIIVIGAFIFGLDTAFMKLLGLVMNIAG